MLSLLRLIFWVALDPEGGGFLPTASGTTSPSSTSAPASTPTQTDKNVKVSFDTATLTMTYQLGDSAPTGGVVNAVAEGQGSGKLFVNLTGSTGQPDPNIESAQSAVTGVSARIVVTPKAGLAPGVYKGTLNFQACPDPACAANYAGSPWQVSYTLTVTMAYATLDTSAYGIPRTMVYDAVRGDIYASYSTSYGSPGLSAIAKFHWSGAGWASSTLSIPGLLDIALATDASVLAATDLGSQVNLIDPVTFSLKHTYVAAAGIGDQGSSTEVGIAFTNDGKLWMPTGTGTSWHGLGYFDLRTLTFGNSTPPCTSCYMGPAFAVSGDGSRLMVSQHVAVPSDALHGYGRRCLQEQSRRADLLLLPHEPQQQRGSLPDDGQHGV
jgi:hypothetical protein